MPIVTNGGDAIITSLSNALNLVLTFVPKLIGFLVILLIGWIIASVSFAASAFLHVAHYLNVLLAVFYARWAWVVPDGLLTGAWLNAFMPVHMLLIPLFSNSDP